VIPRIHKRGTSFKTALTYILHDPQKETAERVDWAFSVNCGTADLFEAWRPMYETWDRRNALKRENGIDLRGRDNKAPVMHYTLSWEPGDKPSKQQMMDAALKSLKALGLEDHQAAIAAHNDKDHLHVHIVVNTVNPITGRTAPLKYPALALRDLAREHDRQRGIYQAERDAAALKLPPYTRNSELREKNMELLRPRDIVDQIRPEKPRPEHRRRALERSDVVNRMKRHRAEHDYAHMVERDALWAVHRAERDDLYRRSTEACHVAIDYVRDRFKSRWRDIYEAQRIEWKHVERIQHSPLERAVYVFVNSERLANGKGLSMKRKAELIASPTKLFQAVERVHARERAGLAQVEKIETKERLDRVWRTHEVSFENLKSRQKSARDRMRTEQHTENDRDISYFRAAQELEDERRGLIPERRAERAGPLEGDIQYVKRIKREINAHYRRQHGPDSVPFIPWKERPAPPPEPDLSPPVAPDHVPDLTPVQPTKKRARDNDYDHEL
jgi:hypothetical protein